MGQLVGNLSQVVESGAGVFVYLGSLVFQDLVISAVIFTHSWASMVFLVVKL